MSTSHVGSAMESLAQLAPLFIGSGTTSGTKTQQANPNSVQALTTLLNSGVLSPNAAASQSAAAEQNAMMLMLQSGAPQILGNSVGTGLYNSSQTAQAISQLEAQTSAFGAQMQLNQMNQNIENTNAVSNSLNQMTSGVKENTVTSPTISPAVTGLGAAAILGNSLLPDNTKSKILQALGFGNDVAGGGINATNLGAAFDSTAQSFAPNIASLGGVAPAVSNGADLTSALGNISTNISSILNPVSSAVADSAAGATGATGGEISAAADTAAADAIAPAAEVAAPAEEGAALGAGDLLGSIGGFLGDLAGFF